MSEKNILSSVSSSERYEYPSPIKLDEILGNYFAIPSSIILNTDINEKRATIFSYFSTRRGIGCELSFSVNNIAKWSGKKPDRHSNGVNAKIMQIIEHLNDTGYLTFFDELDHSSCMDAFFNLSKVSQECDRYRFAIIYLDELKQILNYKNLNPKDSFANNDVVLLVFAYLRMKIYRRKNMLFPEEINIDNKNNHKHDIETRRLRSPDAYDCFYTDISNELSISARSVAKAVEVLSELGLIYYEALPRVQRDGKWRTDHTIFCNAYKREGSFLLANGNEYYLTEVENKKKHIGQKKK